MRKSRRFAGVLAAIALLTAAGVAGSTDAFIRIKGKGPEAGKLVCPGGMTNMGYELNEDGSVFPFDPATHVNDIYTVAVDFFEVERITISAHAGTHLDVPRHFVEGARGLEDLNPEEFVWPAYKVDVSKIDLDPGQLQIGVDDLRDYEREYGRIRPGSLVVLDTSLTDEFFLDDPGDERVVDDDDLAQNVDDLFEFANEGFAGATVQWMFDNRDIAGVGSDAYGPDAADDSDFLATFTTLDNDGVALVALDNVETLSVRGDIIMAPAVRMTEGSGFPVNPIACHSGADDDDDDDDDD